MSMEMTTIDDVDDDIKELEEMLKRKRVAKAQLQAAANNQKLCAVCEEKPSKYKCPNCVIPYCSASCYKEHGTVCTKRQKPNPPTDKTTAANEAKAPENVAEATLTGCLTTTQMKALEQCPEIRKALESKALQELIVNIDSSDDRIELLDKARNRIPEFAEFVEMVLDVISWTPQTAALPA
uniref:HIT-type domain-containing protein n=1 Tax=Eutreptiella gymnastica TaxID=73025 RepID=A0A7S1JIA6_9EUGL